MSKLTYFGFQFLNALSGKQENSPGAMFFAWHSDKVFRTIIKAISIKMMNNPVFRQLFVMCLFPYKYVFINVTIPCSWVTVVQNFAVGCSPMGVSINIHSIFSRYAFTTSSFTGGKPTTTSSACFRTPKNQLATNRTRLLNNLCAFWAVPISCMYSIMVLPFIFAIITFHNNIIT